MILLLASLAMAACPDIDTEVERATAALVSGDFATARTALQAAESSFGCAKASNTQLAHYWLVDGAEAHLQGQVARARASLAAARVIAPDVFDERLGPDVRATWAAAQPDGRGTLLIEPPAAALVNGDGVTVWPVTLPAANHVVQVLGADGKVRYGRLIRIGPGEDAVVETGLGRELLPVADEAAPAEKKGKKSPALLILAGIAAAGAGGLAGGALAQGSVIETSPDVDALDAAFGRQQAFGYGSIALAGASAIALTLHFVIPAR